MTMAFRLSDPPRQRISIVSIPSLLDTNAYQRLLYEQLSAHGIDLLTGATFAVGWMARNRRAAPILHFHWQHLAYIPAIEWGEARGAWRDWFSVVRFGVRLAVARALGYRVVWTVHQLVPHESSQSDWAASVLLAYASHKLIVHDQATADSCRRLPGAARKLAILPHASYAGVYPRQRAGTDVRRGLGLTWARFVFLYFGRIRSYKNVSLLLEAFQSTIGELPDVALVIAGAPADPAQVKQIERAAETDRRIRALLRFVSDYEVADLFAAADASVYPRGDGGTAGSLLLSMSLGTPVVAARVPAYQDLLGEEAAGWLFTPDDAAALRVTLVRAADSAAAAVRGMRAADRMVGRDWTEIGRRTAELLASL
jgi:glycosyltransferase involved in cell wall biosynthesis